MYILPHKPKACELCGREMSALTKHHLIPRSLHRNKRVRKKFGKERCITDVAWLCGPCHKSIHRILSEKAMSAEYFTVDALANHPEIHTFIDWIHTKPAGFTPKY